MRSPSVSSMVSLCASDVRIPVREQTLGALQVEPSAATALISTMWILRFDASRDRAGPSQVQRSPLSWRPLHLSQLTPRDLPLLCDITLPGSCRVALISLRGGWGSMGRKIGARRVRFDQLLDLLRARRRPLSSQSETTPLQPQGPRVRRCTAPQ
jgi:hypothetical protein